MGRCHNGVGFAMVWTTHPCPQPLRNAVHQLERSRQLRGVALPASEPVALVWVEGHLRQRLAGQPDARLHETDPLLGVCRDDAKLVAGYLVDCDDFSVGSKLARRVR